jgi:hypothetical protein
MAPTSCGKTVQPSRKVLTIAQPIPSLENTYKYLLSHIIGIFLAVEHMEDIRVDWPTIPLVESMEGVNFIIDYVHLHGPFSLSCSELFRSWMTTNCVIIQGESGTHTATSTFPKKQRRR